MKEFTEYIDLIIDDIAVGGKEAIILGDLNAASHLWGSRNTDARGRYLVDQISSVNMVIMNDGLVPTFVRGRSESFIDITFCTDGLVSKIRKWKVLSEESLSLHRFVSTEIEIKGGRKMGLETKGRRKLEVNTFKIALEIGSLGGRVSSVPKLTNIIKEAQKIAEMREGGRQTRDLPFWWNDEVEEARTRCNAARRRYTRIRRAGGDLAEVLEYQYREERRKYKKVIRASKRDNWREICEELENDIFGQGYQIAMGKLGRKTPYKMGEDKRREAIMNLFPHKNDNWNRHESVVAVVEPFTDSELKNAAQKMKKGKAPGPDGITVEAIACAVEEIPDQFLDMYNKILREQSFPAAWKKARAVLIPKGNPTENKFRPICLLDTLGKLLEQMLKARLEQELQEKSGLVDRQYGFRTGRSTVGAIKHTLREITECPLKWGALVTIDVKNAFNTATWSEIVRALEARGISRYLINMVENYLNNRRIQEKDWMWEVVQGVPQGSVLGPTLWNVLYDSLLRTALPEGCTMIAYADDVALVINAGDKQQLRAKGNIALTEIMNWMEDIRIEVAPEKSEVVIIKGPRDRRDIHFSMGRQRLIPKASIKYLGVWVDSRLSYREHIQRVVEKGERAMMALNKILPNIKGPSTGKRKVTYAAEVWYQALDKARNRRTISNLQRRTLGRVICAYRTVSVEAMQAVAGVLPVDLLVKERSSRYEDEAGRREARRNSVEVWQERWQQHTQSAAWARRLIPDVVRWVECPWKKTNYYFTQALTGHGSFRTYTKRIGKTRVDTCVYCPEQVDTPEHTVFHCGKWRAERDSMNEELEEILTADNFEGMVTRKKENFETVEAFTTRLMMAKEREERERQSRGED